MAPRSQEPQEVSEISPKETENNIQKVLGEIVSISNTPKANSLPLKTWYTNIKVRQNNSKEVYAVSYITTGVSRSAGSANADIRMHEDFPGEITVSSFHCREAKPTDREMKTLFEVLDTTYEVEFNIKIGKDKYKKCFLIKAKNEKFVRGELQLRCKKEFSNIKSITNIRIKEADENSKEYSEDIIENLEPREVLFTEKDLYKYKVALGKLITPQHPIYLHYASKSADNKIKEELKEIIKEDDDYKNYVLDDEIFLVPMKEEQYEEHTRYREHTIGKPVAEAEKYLDMVYAGTHMDDKFKDNKDDPEFKVKEVDLTTVFNPYVENSGDLVIIKSEKDAVPDEEHRYYKLIIEMPNKTLKLKILTTDRANSLVVFMRYCKANNLMEDIYKAKSVTLTDLRDNNSIDVPITVIRNADKL